MLFTDDITSHQIGIWGVWTPNEHVKLFVVFIEHFLKASVEGPTAGLPEEGNDETR